MLLSISFQISNKIIIYFFLISFEDNLIKNIAKISCRNYINQRDGNIISSVCSRDLPNSNFPEIEEIRSLLHNVDTNLTELIGKTTALQTEVSELKTELTELKLNMAYSPPISGVKFQEAAERFQNLQELQEQTRSLDLDP